MANTTDTNRATRSGTKSRLAAMAVETHTAGQTQTPAGIEQCCLACRTLVGKASAAEPHKSLLLYKAKAIRGNEYDHYTCRKCAAELSRNSIAAGGGRWELIARTGV